MLSFIKSAYTATPTVFSTVPKDFKHHFTNAAIRFERIHPPREWGKKPNLSNTIAMPLDGFGMEYTEAATQFMQGGATAFVVNTEKPDKAIEIAKCLHGISRNQTPHVIIDDNLDIAREIEATGYLASTVQNLKKAKQKLGDEATVGLKAISSFDLRSLDSDYALIGWEFDGKPVSYQTINHLKRDFPNIRIVVTLPNKLGYGHFGNYARLIGPNDGLAIAVHPFPEEDGPHGIAKMLSETYKRL